jgi:DNA repair exonuclease SbcCD nuclease subunit
VSKYKGFIISDIHVGASNLDKLKNEYHELFITKIEKAKKLDFVVVCGDYFDHKFYLNDKEAKYAYAMLKELVYACKERNIPLRFVYGTESHECNQYDILSLLQIYENIKVIKYAEEEEILPNLWFLYLPEEHIVDKKEYYKEYFDNDKKYDYVFGHGVVREVMKELAVHMDNKDTSKRKKVPVFNSEELTRICKGQIYFGHYHINEEYNNKIFSIGSFTRWKFGEEGRKGFYEVECDTEKMKYENKYIENTMADEYKTIYFGYDNKIFQSEESMHDVMEGIDKLIEREPYNHIRFTFNIPSDSDNPESLMNYLKEKFKYKDQVKVEITNGYIDEKRKIKKEKVEKENLEFSFIFDKSIPLEDKVGKFISIIYTRDIPTSNISLYIYNPLNEIIDKAEGDEL